MANGKTHMTVNVLTGIALTSYTYFNTTINIEPIVWGSILGTFITPDYDLKHNLPKSLICKIPIISIIWKVLWWPYYKVLKHRSFVSHSLVIGTLFRILYISLWFVIPLYIAIGNDIFYINISEDIYLIVLVWCLQDATHIFLDKWGSK